MKPEEYIKTITVNDQQVDLGIDDYGQCYFIEWTDNSGTHEMSLGTYNTRFMEDILYIFDSEYQRIMQRVFLDEALTEEDLKLKEHYEELIKESYL